MQFSIQILSAIQVTSHIVVFTETARDCDCLLSIGTSGVVMSAARIPEVALENGAAVIHINVQPVEVSVPGEFSLVQRAGELLPALLQQSFPTS